MEEEVLDFEYQEVVPYHSLPPPPLNFTFSVTGGSMKPHCVVVLINQRHFIDILYFSRPQKKISLLRSPFISIRQVLTTERRGLPATMNESCMILYLCHFVNHVYNLSLHFLSS